MLRCKVLPLQKLYTIKKNVQQVNIYCFYGKKLGPTQNKFKLNDVVDLDYVGAVYSFFLKKTHSINQEYNLLSSILAVNSSFSANDIALLLHFLAKY